MLALPPCTVTAVAGGSEVEDMEIAATATSHRGGSVNMMTLAAAYQLTDILMLIIGRLLPRLLVLTVALTPLEVPLVVDVLMQCTDTEIWRCTPTAYQSTQIPRSGNPG